MGFASCATKRLPKKLAGEKSQLFLSRSERSDAFFPPRATDGLGMFMCAMKKESIKSAGKREMASDVHVVVSLCLVDFGRAARFDVCLF